MLVIPIQPVPSQIVLAVLGGQNCQMAIYQKPQGIFFDLNSNGVDMSTGIIARNAVPLDPHDYDGFIGNLIFIDTQGLDDPFYSGLGSRFRLVYLDAAELAATLIPNAIPSQAPVILGLMAILTATSSGPGPFTVAHGLGVVPAMIELIPTSPGAIWAEVGLFDDVNVNLSASAGGLTATVLVFLPVASNSSFLTPAVILDAISPAQPPDTFSVAHGLGVEPSFIEILPDSGGMIWAQSPAFDATNIYLAASDEGIEATVFVYRPPSGGLNILAPAATLIVTSNVGGNFNVLHGLSAVPSRIVILPMSAGTIWAQSPAFNGSNVNLIASDADVTAMIFVFA